MKYNSKVDSNQPEIVEALRKHGATVLHTHSLKNAFDILVGFNGNLFMIEIKDGNKPPSQRKLTSGELECETNFERVGVKYHVVLSIKDALDVIDPTRGKYKEILNDCCDLFGIKPNELSMIDRRSEIVFARQLASYIIKKYSKKIHTKESLKSIAKIFGGENHATIISSINQITYYLKAGKSFESNGIIFDIEKVKKTIDKYMIHIEPIRPEAEHCGVIEVNDKIITYKNGELYGVPEGDLTPTELKAVENYLKGLK